MKTFKQYQEACWKGYKQVGGKMKDGRMVPNCVPVKEEELNEKNVPTSPEKWAKAKAAAKAKFAVYPSAYANGWAAKKYKAMGGGWKSVSEGKHTSTIAMMAAHKYEPEVGHKIETRKGGQIPGTVTKVENGKVHFTHPEGKKYITHVGNVRRVNEVLDTPAAQDSYIKKARASAEHLKGKKATNRYMNVIKVQTKGITSKIKNIKKSLGEDLNNEDLRKWFKDKWVRFDTKGNIKGDCAREPGEGKPKCLPQAKAHALGKKARAAAAQKKRREDPNPERKGKAIFVKTKVNEKWSAKYKASIDCSRPKGFSQRAHCQGKKK